MTAVNASYEDVMIRPINRFDTEDARKLIGLLMTTDAGWPGGLQRGVKPHVAGMMPQLAGWSCEEVFVAEAHERFLGICELKAPEADGDTAYVAFLYADPAIHGLGIGKRLLRAALDHCIRSGWREVTLHTWAGNEKAMPLYKRMGFFWSPESDVYMRCFIPAVVNSEPGKRFFEHAGRDWYTCLKNPVALVQDKDSLDGMPVFSYRFEDDEDVLAAAFDCASGGLTYIKAPGIEASCTFTGLNGPSGTATAGQTLLAKWMLNIAADEATQAELRVTGSNRLPLSLSKTLNTGEPLEAQAQLSISADVQPIRDGSRPDFVTTTITIGERQITLQTGVNIVRPVSVSLSKAVAYPAVWQEAELTLTNNAEREVTVRLSIAACDTADILFEACEVTLKALAVTQISVKFLMNQPGTAIATLMADAVGVHEEIPLVLRCHAGEPLLYVDSYARKVVQETAGSQITQNLDGGRLEFSSFSSGQSLSLGIPDVGPPYNPHRWRNWPYLPGEDSTPARVSVSGHSSERPDMQVTRSVVRLSDNLIRMDIQIENRSAQVFTGAVRLNMKRRRDETLAIPLEHGILYEPTEGLDSFPVCTADFLAEGKSLKEGWFCAEGEKGCSGLIWTGDALFEYEWQPALTLTVPDIEPGAVGSLSPVYIYCGPGGCDEVRGLWKKLTGNAEASELEKHAAIEFGFGKSPLFASADAPLQAQIKTVNHRGAPLSGRIHSFLNGEALASAEPSVLPQNHDHTIDVVVPNVAGLTAELEATLQLPRYDLKASATVIVTGSAGQVDATLEEENARKIFTVDNGVVQFRVSPNFVGSLFSARYQEREYLYSAYPQERPLVWANPWFGGVHPYLEWIGSYRLSEETFEGGIVHSRAGETGIAWSGVKVCCEAAHRQRRGLRVTAEYLTRKDAPLIAVVVTWENISDGHLSLPESGIACWSATGGVGARGERKVSWKKAGKRHERRQSHLMHEQKVESPVIIADKTGRHSLLMVAGGSDSGPGIKMEDFGPDGAHIGTGGEMTLKPGESKRTLLWLVFDPADQDIDRLEMLKSVDNLP
jgi:GNAT superfamily N-acetyltransferase